jgi:DNA repair exonuclease SbcCD nuclease subunit
MADVHLGARHHDLGDAAAAQRERQFAAFSRGVDLALTERVDLVLIAGDLFDSNTQPRRSVERAAGELGRLVAAGIGTLVAPGTHDCYEPGSLYRTYDLAAMAGARPGSDELVVFTPARPVAVYPGIGVAVHGPVADTKRAPASPLAAFSPSADANSHWRIGVLHGSLRIPGKVEQDDVLFTDEEVARSGLDYLALGHWHSFLKGRAGGTTWAYAGAPEPVAVDQDGAGQVLLVTLEERDGRREVLVEPRAVGRTRFLRLDVDTGDAPTQQVLVRRLLEHADPDLVLSVRLTGVRPEGFDLDEDEVQSQAAGSFFRLTFRDASVPALADGPPPPADTIAGAFALALGERIATAEREGRVAEAAEAREALRLGRALLDEPARVTLG